MVVTKYNTLIGSDRYPCLMKEQEADCPGIDALNMPDKVVSVLQNIFLLGRQTEERVYVLALDNKTQLIGALEVGHGTDVACTARTREVFMKALLLGAHSIIIAHNHPSGNPLPSKDDMENAKILRQAGELLCVPLLDSIIVSTDKYYSFQEAGFFEEK